MTAQPPTPPTPPAPGAVSTAWLIPFGLIIGAGAAYLVGQLLSPRALTLVLALATGLIVGAPVALLCLAIMRRATVRAIHESPLPAPTPMWDPPQTPIIQINLDDLIQRRAAMTPLPPQYLQLGQPDPAHPARVVGFEEWT